MRVQQRTSAVISWSPVDADGEPAVTDPGVVTVTITRADGTALYTNAATSGAGTAARTYTLTATDTSLLDNLTATWKVAGVTVGVTYVEIVGRYYFTIGEMRGLEPSLSDPTKYSFVDAIVAREEVETSFESWTNMAWVPRFSTITIPAGSSILDGDVHAVTGVRWARTHTDTDTYTVLTAAELAELRGTSAGTIEGVFWGGTHAVLGIELGRKEPPIDLKNAAIRYARYVLNRNKSGVPRRAETMTTPDGISIGFRRAGTEWAPTGIEDIDEVLRRVDIDHRNRRKSISLTVTRDDSSSYFRSTGSLLVVNGPSWF